MANYFDTGIQLTAGFSLSSQAPLDGRSVVELLTDLDTHITENRAYEGMCVYVKENKKIYIYNGTTWEEFVGGGSAEPQIKDWVSGNSYLEGDYIYHEGEIYRCLASNSDVDFDEANWIQVTYGIDELSKEDVERLLGLTEEELEAMASLISDTEVRIDKTYSSSKIYTDIQQCLEDSKTYTLEEISKLNGSSYKVVTSTSEMTSESIIYLLASGNTYDMYIVEENGATTKIGNMDVNLDNYFTKAEIEADFLKKVDADGKYATITTVDGKVDKTDLTTHTGDTDIHITSDERTKWNDTADKVDGAELVKKADIVTTTLDENATNDDIYGGKAIYDAIKANCIGKETVLYEGTINNTGTYTLADDVNNYDFIVISHCTDDNLKQSIVLTKNEISTCIDTNSSFTCVKTKGSTNLEINGYFNGDKIVISKCLRQNITSIVGYKFGRITVENTITNPAVGKSYSTDEQLTGGTWIDGKPIYRKTVDCGALPNNDGKDTPHGIANIDKVIDTYGIAFDNSGINVSLPFADASSDGSISAYRNGAIIRITTAKDRTSFTESYITIEYTKTTD